MNLSGITNLSDDSKNRFSIENNGNNQCNL